MLILILQAPQAVVNILYIRSCTLSSIATCLHTALAHPCHLQVLYTTTEAFTAIADMASTSIRDGGIGAAVGVIIGILLGAAFVWFYSAKQRQDRPGEPVVYLREPSREEEEFVKLVPKILTTMTHFRLCRNDGPDLRKALGMACAGFSMHTRHYYHTDKLPKVPESLDENLRRLFLGEELTRALKELIMNPKTRYHALTHLQVRVVLSNLDIHTIGPLSLLPLFVTEFFKSLPLSTSSYSAQHISRGKYSPVSALN